jgi:hypothetical protein
MHGCGSDGVHFWLRDVPGDHGNPVLPNKQLFVVGRTYKFILLNEGYSIDCAKMLIVFHGLGASSQVELIYLLRTRTTQKDAGMIF